METYFASPQRADPLELERQIQFASHNPVIDGVMQTVGGLIAVLNQHRQILVVNQRLLTTLGVDDPEDTFGLRPGEVFGCRYAQETEAGCGTSEYCMTCGAAIAIVAGLGGDEPVERTCAINTGKNGNHSDLYFHVHAAPFRIKAEKFILLFLYDITQQQHRAALERTFFHDINNTIMGLINASELLRHSTADEARQMARQIVSLSARLSREVELQRNLSSKGTMEFNLGLETLPVDEIIKEIQQSLTYQPVMRGKSLEVQNSAPDLCIDTDHALLHRVLSNMLINAFEATERNDLVRLNIEAQYRRAVFSVWNRASMASAVACRVFQRNFSTKADLGRGLGTYSMKLIAEGILGGRVYFESSPSAGTIFFFELPLHRSSSTVF